MHSLGIITIEGVIIKMNYYYHQDAIHISRVDLYVKNLNNSLSFYLNSLGFSVLKKEKDFVSLTADHTNELIRLYERQNIDNSSNTNIYHFALLLPTRKDLSKFLHHLILKQIPVDGAADHLVSEAIYLRDPDGIGIEITCDKDDNNWDYNNEKIIMDTEPFDYKGVYYESDETDFFVNLPKETIIGHLHLQVNNLSEAKKFYNDVIGFQITNEEIKDAIFMSDKKYHHHLAINSWQNKKTDKDLMLKSFEISYPNCEKYINTINKLDESKINYQETSEGILIKDSDNTEIYLKI